MSAAVPAWARWTCTVSQDRRTVHRFDLFLSAHPATDTLRGTWTALTDDELRAMLTWLSAAGIEVVAAGATEKDRPNWPEGWDL